MSIKLMCVVWEMQDISSTTKLVLLALADSCNDHGVCWPSLTTIARKSSLARSTVAEVLRNLEGLAIVERERGNVGRSTRYTVRLASSPPAGLVRVPDYGSPPAGLGSPRTGLGVVRVPDYGSPPAGHDPSLNRKLEPSMNTQNACACDYTQFLAIKAAYPAGTYGQHHWQTAQHSINRLCEDGQSTPDNLLELVTSFAKQQTAMGRIGTQYVTSPNKFFEGGMWQGPFPLPKAAQKVQPEKPERVRFIPPEYRDEEAANVSS